MSPLAREIAAVAGMMLLTSSTEIAGLRLLDPIYQRYSKDRGLPRHGLVLATIAMALLALHVVQIGEYAALYRAVGALPNVEAAVYFSSSVYSTIGATDVRLPPEWRLVGSLEGINGMVLVGWSTAFLFGAWRTVLHADDKR